MKPLIEKIHSTVDAVGLPKERIPRAKADLLNLCVFAVLRESLTHANEEQKEAIRAFVMNLQPALFFAYLDKEFGEDKVVGMVVHATDSLLADYAKIVRL